MTEAEPEAAIAVGPSVCLRLPRDADVGLVNRWLGDTQVWGWVSTYPEPLLVEAVSQLGDFAAIIEKRGTTSAVGYCLMRCEEPWNRNGVLDVVIGEAEYRGRALGVEATTLFLDVLFRRRRLHRVEARVADDNYKCLSAIRKYGFREEGFLRDRFMRDGGFRGVYVFSLLAREFAQLRVVKRILSHSGLTEEANTTKGDEHNGCRRPGRREKRAGQQGPEHFA
jgi:RimJ/RimL family protein N-acetyltransferase